MLKISTKYLFIILFLFILTTGCSDSYVDNTLAAFNTLQQEQVSLENEALILKSDNENNQKERISINNRAELFYKNLAPEKQNKLLFICQNNQYEPFIVYEDEVAKLLDPNEFNVFSNLIYDDSLNITESYQIMYRAEELENKYNDYINRRNMLIMISQNEMIRRQQILSIYQNQQYQNNFNNQMNQMNRTLQNINTSLINSNSDHIVVLPNY